MKIKLILSVLLLCISTCSSLDLRNHKNLFKLSAMDQLKLETTNQADIRNRFGVAQLEVAIEDEKREVWLYYDALETHRLTVSFNSNSKNLISFTWKPNWREESLKSKDVRKYFPGSGFKRHKITFQYVPCAIESETTLVDNSAGIAIGVHDENISYVAWQKPGTIEEKDGWLGYVKGNSRPLPRTIADRRLPYDDFRYRAD